MTALSGRVSFLVTIIIILHLNIDSCSGNTRKHNLVEAKAKNASLVKHADGNIAPRHSGTMANKLHCLRWGKIKKSTFENGQDYQQSMDTDAALPAGDRTMDARVHYCGQCVIGTRQQPFICRDCATTNTNTAAAPFTCRRCSEGTPAQPFTCRRCSEGTPAQPFTCRRCTQDNPDLESCLPTSTITTTTPPPVSTPTITRYSDDDCDQLRDWHVERGCLEENEKDASTILFCKLTSWSC